MNIPSSNLGRTCCVQKLFLTFRPIFVHNMFSSCSAKRRASDKDLPVTCHAMFGNYDLGIGKNSYIHYTTVHNSVPHKSVMHHDIKNIIHYHIFYLFAPIYK